MKRRDFLKTVGLFVFGATSLEVCSENVFSAEVTSNLFGTKVINYARKQAGLISKHGLNPSAINGEKYYIMLMHPKQKYALDVIGARTKYKHERWLKRYNKWAKTQGKPPFQMVEGELGELGTM